MNHEDGRDPPSGGTRDVPGVIHRRLASTCPPTTRKAGSATWIGPRSERRDYLSAIRRSTDQVDGGETRSARAQATETGPRRGSIQRG